MDIKWGSAYKLQTYYRHSKNHLLSFCLAYGPYETPRSVIKPALLDLYHILHVLLVNTFLLCEADKIPPFYI